ncbi:MAG: hypothetical protein M3N41_05650 [Acidobacteriota bacterium]|nr:hypothetical protein [Acidobacteriota bacterium]
MSFRSKPWRVALAVAVLCAAAGAVFHGLRNPAYDAGRLLAMLPAERATLVYIDTGSLRKSGLLDLVAGSKAAEEADYRKFVEQTGFDYRTDLDAVAAAFVDGRVYATLRGRFQWTKLAAYAESQGGQCRDAVCSMPGSSPERNISYYQVASNVLALAVSPDARGVTSVGPNARKVEIPAAADPVWMSVPAAVFNRLEAFPDGTRAFLSPLARAEKITFAAGPQGDRLELRLEVVCPTADAAADLAKQLASVTGLLKDMIGRAHMTPNPRDLSGVLVAGRFEQRAATVVGTWPIERGFVEALASGQIQ